MRQFTTFISSLLLLFSISCDAFSIQNSRPDVKINPKQDVDVNVDVSRRTLFQNVSNIAVTSIGILTLQNKPAQASGGATAGGAYLLSAKQRYNQRVTEGVKSFLALSTSLENGSLEETKVFFTSDDAGYWKDSSSAGYLLSNAFRRSSTTPPDSLPSVKKWKAFAAELDVLQKSLKKKDLKGVKSSYEKAEVLLDAYLDAVELPPVIDMRM